MARESPRARAAGSKSASGLADGEPDGGRSLGPGEPPSNGEGAARLQDALRVAIADVQQVIDPVGTKLKFMVDPDLKQLVVSVVDVSSNETIRQIPAEEVLQMARSLQASKLGLLLQQKA